MPWTDATSRHPYPTLRSRARYVLRGIRPHGDQTLVSDALGLDRREIDPVRRMFAGREPGCDEPNLDAIVRIRPAREQKP
jgi:hypothetical protein